MASFPSARLTGTVGNQLRQGPIAFIRCLLVLVPKAAGDGVRHDRADQLLQYFSRFGFHAKSYQLHWPNLTVPLNPVLKFIVDRCSCIFKILAPAQWIMAVVDAAVASMRTAKPMPTS